ncbi:hypothetical protein KO489_01280 [Reinekea forsetii]|nr:hypothetical protein [Reinekea forsetii]
MNHKISLEDLNFKGDVEHCRFPVPDFNHKAHVRLAYIYIVEHGVSESVDVMKRSLYSLLQHAGIDPAEKYHATLTQAWLQAVNHFIVAGEAYDDFEQFIEHNPKLLDTNVMFTHYSKELLFSPEAREAYVSPNIEPF